MARQPRVRDYRAEEAARNARAQARGFRNRYEERALRAEGRLPTARQEAADPNAARRAGELGRARSAGFDSYSEYRSARREAQAWSMRHSRQPVSEYSPRMSPTQFRDYYRALVKPWGQRRTPEDKAALRQFIVNSKHHLTEREYDESPRY